MRCNIVCGPAYVLENDKHPSYCVGDTKTGRIFRTELLPSLLESVKGKKLSYLLQSVKKKRGFEMFTVAFCCNKYSKLRCPKYASKGDRIAQTLDTWKLKFPLAVPLDVSQN